jgi:rRNA maturation RNase YbeY
MQALNAASRARRGHRRDVCLPLDGRDELPAGLERQLGDVVVCHARAARQAEGGCACTDEMRTLVVHGLLHPLGHDHEVDAGEMLARQAQLRDMLPALSDVPVTDRHGDVTAGARRVAACTRATPACIRAPGGSLRASRSQLRATAGPLAAVDLADRTGAHGRVARHGWVVAPPGGGLLRCPPWPTRQGWALPGWLDAAAGTGTGLALAARSARPRSRWRRDSSGPLRRRWRARLLARSPRGRPPRESGARPRGGAPSRARAAGAAFRLPVSPPPVPRPPWLRRHRPRPLRRRCTVARRLRRSCREPPARTGLVPD